MRASPQRNFRQDNCYNYTNNAVCRHIGIHKMIQLEALYCAQSHSRAVELPHQSFTTLSTQFRICASLHHPLHSDSHLLALSAHSVFFHSPLWPLRVKPEIFSDMGRLLYTETSFDSPLLCCLPKYRGTHSRFQMTFLEWLFSIWTRQLA